MLAASTKTDGWVLLLLLVSSSVLAIGSDGKECQTVDGPDVGKECVFPFVYASQVFDACTIVGDGASIPWCSTKTDKDGAHEQGHWGHCDPSCAGDDDPKALSNDDAIFFGDDDPAAAPGGDADKIDSVGVGAPADDDYDGAAEEDTIKECTTPSGSLGTCQPLGLCVTVDLGDTSSDGCGPAGLNASIVCCTKRLKNDFVPQLTSAEARPSLDGGQLAVTVDEVNSRLGLEEPEVAPQTLASVDVDALEGDLSPEQFHLRFNQPRDEAFDIDAAAASFLHATSDLQEDNDLDKFEAGIGLRFFDADTSSSINRKCPWTPEPDCSGKGHLMYRTLDGSCNNLNVPNYGRAGTPFQRILQPQYKGSSLHLPRSSASVGRFDLPSARWLSQKLTRPVQQDSREKSRFQSLLVMQMGQFVDHDLTHTPNHAVECCNSDGSFPGSYDAEKCFPISVPFDDPFWKGRRTCMGLARSLASPSLKCNLEFRQQMNQITHWLDGSNIYGSSVREMRSLRTLRNGQLRSSRRLSSGSHHSDLPVCSLARENVETCRGCQSCFYAGDVRSNEQVNLLVFHTLWMREHNRISKQLGRLNPKWNDETLFQESRRIVVAEYQHIIYKEWLPLILGNEFMTTFGLWPLSEGFSPVYKDSPDLDPRITNEFATAAFRFGHSLIPPSFERRSRSLQSKQKLKMSQLFFNPGKLQRDPRLLDDLAAGLTQQKGQLWDNGFSVDILNHLFENPSGAGGLDLIALNIQRGRDHGLPGYNRYREICEMGKAAKWEDLEDLISPGNVGKLRQAYEHVDDVDLYVGGFLELPHSDSTIGPTFKCIIGDTFARLKILDRFFYDLSNAGDGQGSSSSARWRQTRRFTASQLREIRKATMARIICDNTDSVDRIQPQAFRAVGSPRANRLQSCRNSAAIPRMNLAVFRS